MPSHTAGRPSRGQSDESQLEWAAAEGRVLITFNVAHFAGCTRYGCGMAGAARHRRLKPAADGDRVDASFIWSARWTPTSMGDRLSSSGTGRFLILRNHLLPSTRRHRPRRFGGPADCPTQGVALENRANWRPLLEREAGPADRWFAGANVRPREDAPDETRGSNEHGHANAAMLSCSASLPRIPGRRASRAT